MMMMKKMMIMVVVMIMVMMMMMVVLVLVLVLAMAMVMVMSVDDDGADGNDDDGHDVDHTNVFIIALDCCSFRSDRFGLNRCVIGFGSESYIRNMTKPLAENPKPQAFEEQQP